MKETYSETPISIPIDGKQTSGIITRPHGDKAHTAIIVAHGAGNNMLTPLLESYARGMASAGYPVVRFNFIYADQGKRAPDKQEVLERTWVAVFEYSRLNLIIPADRWVAAGKSMGGRIASQLAADGKLPADRLIFLGYPLHPANDTERVRDSHLYKVETPMLFFAGTRDPLCNISKLTDVLHRLKAPHELVTIDGADHSFHVPKSRRKPDNDIYSEIIDRSIDWLSR